MSAKQRWGWVRILPERPGGGMFEACALIPDGPPGEGWIEVDDRIVDLLFAMQSEVFKARGALAKAKRSIHSACDTVEQARQEVLR